MGINYNERIDNEANYMLQATIRLMFQSIKIIALQMQRLLIVSIWRWCQTRSMKLLTFNELIEVCLPTLSKHFDVFCKFINDFFFVLFLIFFFLGCDGAVIMQNHDFWRHGIGFYIIISGGYDGIFACATKNTAFAFFIHTVMNIQAAKRIETGINARHSTECNITRMNQSYPGNHSEKYAQTEMML